MAAQKLHLPLLPLRDVVIYPHMVIPLFVGRERSIAALDQAMASDKHIFLVSQRDAGEDDPAQDGLYSIGTVANILQLLKLPDGTIKVLVEGQRRGHLLSLTENDDAYIAQVEEVQQDELTKRNSEVLVTSLKHI